MGPHHRLLSIRVLLLSCCVLLWVFGCSEQASNPISPGADEDTTSTLALLSDTTTSDPLAITDSAQLILIDWLLDDVEQLLDIDSVLETDYEKKSSDTADITADSGGEIDLLGLNDLTRVLVGDSSLLNDAVITVESYRPLDEANRSELLFVFGPSGLVFERAITVEIDAAVFDDPSRSGRSVEIAWQYYNSTLGAWEEYDRITVSPDQIFRIPVSHFSTYRAIATRYEAFSQGGQQ